ncbi:MAG: membrane protein insertase YidC [Spirochaetales bacterium]|jgi:YidC/Oxa1 family membrane protein insertase|nr:membrane protein insertase YidC [Spirochaetales bacterium]
MDKKTVLAMVLCMIVFLGGFYIQQRVFLRGVPEEAQELSPEEPVFEPPALGAPEAPEGPPETPAEVSPVEEETIPFEEVFAETDVFLATLSNRGGVITSLKLKDHLDRGEPLEIIERGGPDQAAFNLLLGGADAPPLTEPFHVRKSDNGREIEFWRTRRGNDGIPYTLRKIYTFIPGEYLLELKIIIENSRSAPPAINYQNFAYTLEFGPQIGPPYVRSNRYDYRYYYNFNEGKAQRIRIKDDVAEVGARSRWAAVAGKYFTVIGIPDASNYKIGFNQHYREGLDLSSVMTFSRPLIANTSRSEDVFRFYLGPKTTGALSIYNKAEDNALGLSSMEMEGVVERNVLIGWLEWLLQMLLILAHALVRNWGVAIIIVTLIVKVALYPLTRKSTQATAKMQALNPQMEELKRKYGNNMEKLNQEMTALYKKEGVSPLSGCLPMLLQFPIIIAMYGLVSKYFDLRGAVFIPGWITDLSTAEAVYTFSGFRIPLLGWDAIRLLPIIFVLSQIFYGKLMQTGGTQANSQMKMLNMMMPVMFFFILYNAPSGLLVYWISQNLFTIIQQIWTMRMQRRKQE